MCEPTRQTCSSSRVRPLGRAARRSLRGRRLRRQCLRRRQDRRRARPRHARNRRLPGHRQAHLGCAATTVGMLLITIVTTAGQAPSTPCARAAMTASTAASVACFRRVRRLLRRRPRRRRRELWRRRHLLLRRHSQSQEGCAQTLAASRATPTAMMAAPARSSPCAPTVLTALIAERGRQARRLLLQ